MRYPLQKRGILLVLLYGYICYSEAYCNLEGQLRHIDLAQQLLSSHSLSIQYKAQYMLSGLWSLFSNNLFCLQSNSLGVPFNCYYNQI